jgi:hypothetical protein
MSGVGWQPAGDGFREVRYDPQTGVQIDQRTSAEIKAAQEKKLAERKAAMQRYEQRTRDAQEKLLKRAAGVQEERAAVPFKDELDLVIQNLLGDPAGTLDGKGSASLRTLTDEQRRARRRAALDEQAAQARKDLDKFLHPEEEAPDYSWASVSEEELESILDDDDDDPYGVFDDELEEG